MNLRLAVSSFLTVLAVSSSSLAEEKRTPREWYGWQILASDTATVTTTALLTLQRENDFTQLNFAAGYFAAPAVIHVAHANYAGALGSLGTRAALPFFAAMTGCAIYGDDHEFGCLTGIGVGALVGMSAAIAIDSAAFSYAEPKKRPAPKSFEVLPSANVSGRGATFGLQGIF